MLSVAGILPPEKTPLLVKIPLTCKQPPPSEYVPPLLIESKGTELIPAQAPRDHVFLAGCHWRLVDCVELGRNRSQPER